MADKLHELDFHGLAIMDGGSHNAEFRKRISLVSKDCQDRTGDSKAREIDVKIRFEPVVDQNGYVTDTKMTLDIKSKLPAYQSKPYSVGARRRGDQGTFVFNEDSLDNVNQDTLDFNDDDE